jgi:MipA family protein
MKPIFRIAAGVLGAALVASPAAAQDAGQDPGVFGGDHLTVGAGAIYGPSYDGSDDMVFTPIPIVQGQIGGIGITPRAGGVALDFIPDGDGPIGFSLGPSATFSGNRRRQVEDEVVLAAGKLKSAIEVGVSGSVNAKRVLNPYDTLSLSADVRWDVNGAHEGMTVTPAITYLTPLSRAALASLTLSARHVDDGYARYYYSVTPAQNVASGLPVYNAKGGWDSASATLFTGYDLSGDITDGGFALIGIVSYSRMLNDGKDTPFTSIRGDADQWMFGAGVAYTFGL